MQFLYNATTLPAFQKHSMLCTFIEQLGYISIASIREELRAESDLARAAMHDAMGIDAYNEMKNDEAEASANAMFGEDQGFSSVDPLPKAQLFSAYKLMYGHMRSTQAFIKYPCKTLGEQIDSTAVMQENQVDLKKLVEATDEMLTKQAEDNGMDHDIMDASYKRRKTMNADTKAKREDTLKARVMTAFADAYPDSVEKMWVMLPAYAQWRIMITIYKSLNRAAGSLKADAEKDVKNPWSTAAADYDKVVVMAGELKEELLQLQADKGPELKAAYENKKLFDNHSL